MAATLQFADEAGAYALTDRGTFMAQRAQLEHLELMVGGGSISENADPALMNPYSVIPVNPEENGGIQDDLAQKFIDWLLSLDTQERIAVFGIDQFGQPLFFPDSERWRSTRP
ncbi:MAG: tungstate ABC transporter, partial [Chloroflexi bacterium]|nr:tungstate ABC transporter [Chloroflexota bacterium]